MQTIPTFAYACGLGAGNMETRFGAEVIAHQLSSQKFSPVFFYPQFHAQGLDAMPALAQINLDLAKQAFIAAEKNQKFITLGGDHSCAIGTWSGAAAAIHSRGDLGLIWFDAHMDSHTPATSPSNNIHGMPLACLLGHGDPALTHILNDHPKIKPENLCLIGIRSFESEEKKLLDTLQVRIFYMDEILERGLDIIIQEALEIVTRHTRGFGISFDLDVMDPLAAPGVGSPADNGLQPESLLQAIKPLENHPLLIGLEIAEYNPSLDRDENTLKFALELINTIFD